MNSSKMSIDLPNKINHQSVAKKFIDKMSIDLPNKINHQSVAKNFIDKFSSGLNFGISFVDAYFNSNCSTLCSNISATVKFEESNESNERLYLIKLKISLTSCFNVKVLLFNQL